MTIPRKRLFSCLAVVALGLAQAAVAGAATLNCELQVPAKKYGYDLLAHCRFFELGQYSHDYGTSTIREEFSPLVETFDPKKTSPSSDRVFHALDSMDAATGDIRRASDLLQGLTSDFSQLREILKRDGNWNSCSPAIWRECTVIALSAEPGRSMDAKSPSAFIVTQKDKLALLSTFLNGVTQKQVGRMDLDALRERIKGYESAYADMTKAASQSSDIQQKELVQAVEEFLNTVLPKAN
jgi:hypothetical protein